MESSLQGSSELVIAISATIAKTFGVLPATVGLSMAQAAVALFASQGRAPTREELQAAMLETLTVESLNLITEALGGH